ncbi:MAG: YbjN domain-containing protein [Clostridiales bacterium]|nr:YbjN domain-containing protein [Clostridiales bacterium]
MNEKELKGMKVSEETDHDGVEMEIEELKVEIDRMIKHLNEVSPKEKVIMDKIRHVLDEHELKYSYEEDEPKHVRLGFGIDNKPFEIHIILQNGKVIFKLSFPFRVQSNAFPLMCMFMAGFNEIKAFALLNLDIDNGELTMRYSYMLEDPAYFNDKYFWVNLASLIRPALEIYTKVSHLAVGMVSGEDRKLYKKLLEMALETVNGDFDDDNVSYGTKSLKLGNISDITDLFGKEDRDESKEDDCASDDEDIRSNIMRSLRGRTTIPGFEGFMRMKAQAEENDEEDSNDMSEKPASMLSMFARRDENKDPKVVGGNEDE